MPGIDPSKSGVRTNPKTGVAEHKHDGYARSDGSLRWHKVSQTHGSDRQTRNLHIASGLGSTGMGGMDGKPVEPPDSVDIGARGAIYDQEKHESRQRTLSRAQLGAKMALTGMGMFANSAAQGLGIARRLLGAMVSGNPLSAASGMLGATLSGMQVVSSNVEEVGRRYKVMDDADKEILAGTLKGKRYLEERKAVEDANSECMEWVDQELTKLGLPPDADLTQLTEAQVSAFYTALGRKANDVFDAAAKEKMGGDVSPATRAKVEFFQSMVKQTQAKASEYRTENARKAARMRSMNSRARKMAKEAELQRQEDEYQNDIANGDLRAVIAKDLLGKDAYNVSQGSNTDGQLTEAQSKRIIPRLNDLLKDRTLSPAMRDAAIALKKEATENADRTSYERSRERAENVRRAVYGGNFTTQTIKDDLTQRNKNTQFDPVYSDLALTPRNLRISHNLARNAMGVASSELERLKAAGADSPTHPDHREYLNAFKSKRDAATMARTYRLAEERAKIRDGLEKNRYNMSEEDHRFLRQYEGLIEPEMARLRKYEGDYSSNGILQSSQAAANLEGYYREIGRRMPYLGLKAPKTSDETSPDDGGHLNPPGGGGAGGGGGNNNAGQPQDDVTNPSATPPVPATKGADGQIKNVGDDKPSQNERTTRSDKKKKDEAEGVDEPPSETPTAAEGTDATGDARTPREQATEEPVEADGVPDAENPAAEGDAGSGGTPGDAAATAAETPVDDAATEVPAETPVEDTPDEEGDGDTPAAVEGEASAEEVDNPTEELVANDNRVESGQTLGGTGDGQTQPEALSAEGIEDADENTKRILSESAYKDSLDKETLDKMPLQLLQNGDTSAVDRLLATVQQLGHDPKTISDEDMAKIANAVVDGDISKMDVPTASAYMTAMAAQTLDPKGMKDLDGVGSKAATAYTIGRDEGDGSYRIDVPGNEIRRPKGQEKRGAPPKDDKEALERYKEDATATANGIRKDILDLSSNFTTLKDWKGEDFDANMPREDTVQRKREELNDAYMSELTRIYNKAKDGGLSEDDAQNIIELNRNYHELDSNLVKWHNMGNVLFDVGISGKSGFKYDKNAGLEDNEKSGKKKKGGKRDNNPTPLWKQALERNGKQSGKPGEEEEERRSTDENPGGQPPVEISGEQASNDNPDGNPPAGDSDEPTKVPKPDITFKEYKHLEWPKTKPVLDWAYNDSGLDKKLGDFNSKSPTLSPDEMIDAFDDMIARHFTDYSNKKVIAPQIDSSMKFKPKNEQTFRRLQKALDNKTGGSLVSKMVMDGDVESLEGLANDLREEIVNLIHKTPYDIGHYNNFRRTEEALWRDVEEAKKVRAKKQQNGQV